MSTDREKLTLAQKQAANVWDHIDDVLPVLEAARAGRWAWFSNSRCKYVELRIDMRDGGCLIKDRDGNRINPSDLACQHSASGGIPWHVAAAPLGEWQQEQIRATSAKEQTP